ncbi:MAG: DUF1549 domain-containing protein [Planctomycetes bacterium]|nr:DUF1549 domain-containing protein [Planctomycetota bacterium]
MKSCRYLWALFGFLVAAPAPAQEPISFRNDVMAVLSRAGCNQGICHGNLNGRGGFKLSLRSQDLDFDRDALTRASAGRRVNIQNPDASLILLKATGQIAHEGGPRFAVTSDEYRILRGWIAAGASLDPPGTPTLTGLTVTSTEAYILQPKNEVALQVRANFSDGKTKDVASLAVFESTNAKIDVSPMGHVRSTEPGETTIVVRYLDRQATALLAFVPERKGFVWKKPAAHNYIDTHVFARLEKLRVNPSNVCSDGDFLRRAHLDLIGLLPTPDEIRKFRADQAADKRAKVIDALMKRPEFADNWALKWADLLKVEEKQLDKTGVKVFHGWIRQSVADNKPLNEFARALIASRGSTYKDPASNYYRALREPQIRAEAFAQVFLGIRMQCAKCHNHPYNQLTQNDYHQLAAFFPRVQYKIIENKRKDKLDSHEFIGEQLVFMDDKSEVKHPVSGSVLQPKYLGGDVLKLGDKDDRLFKLADWVADAKNPYFARTQANRIWYQLMGRGIVDPEDDFRQSNPPVNAPLLDALASDFAEHRFDQKHLIKTIMLSRTYQLSAIPNATNIDDETNFSHTIIRSLSAEALLDAISQATGVPATFDGYPAGTRAGQLPSLPGLQRKAASEPGTKFLRQFGKPERLLSCSCERSDNTTLAQALQLIAGKLVDSALREPDNRIGKLMKARKSNAEIVDELFLASLCRQPNDRERSALLMRIERAADRRTALEDVLWGLVNSKEFMLRK